MNTRRYIEYRNKKPFTGATEDTDKTEIKLVLEEIKGEEKNIIDLCCGTGRFTIPLAKEGKKVIAIDQSIESVKKITSNNLAFPIQGLAQHIPVKSCWADCILFIHTFQYFISPEDQEKVLSEINRCLKRGGCNFHFLL